jgi:hypothetical protein
MEILVRGQYYEVSFSPQASYEEAHLKDNVVAYNRLVLTANAGDIVGAKHKECEIDIIKDINE